MSQVFILPPETRERMIERIAGFLASVLPGQRVRVTVEKYVRRRSDQQNRYLWGCVYPTILREGGEAMGGWHAQDLHELFLGRVFGWEVLEGFGEKRKRPIKRSSKLSTVEFAAFVADIQQFCAELGIYIPEPNEEAHDEAAA